MAENRRGKDKRFYFTRGQMVLLGGVFTLASVIIYFLGMFVGKQIEGRKMLKPEEPLLKIPVKPSAQGSAGAAGTQSKEELTFYDTLTKPTAARPAVEETPQATKQPEKTVKAQAKASQPKAKEETPAPKATEKQVEKTAPVKETSKTAPPADTAARGENGKGWTVQVNAFPDERSAKTWVDRLNNKGYNAYVTEVRNKGKIWYRVRVGQYGSREEADKVVDSLKNKENFTKAFATSR